MAYFTSKHLKAWIRTYVTEKPEVAARVFAEMRKIYSDDPMAWGDRGWPAVFEAIGGHQRAVELEHENPYAPTRETMPSGPLPDLEMVLESLGDLHLDLASGHMVPDHYRGTIDDFLTILRHAIGSLEEGAPAHSLVKSSISHLLLLRDDLAKDLRVREHHVTLVNRVIPWLQNAAQKLRPLSPHGKKLPHHSPTIPAREYISEKIRTLRREGRPAKQAIRIAFEMARRAGYRSVPSKPRKRRR